MKAKMFFFSQKIISCGISGRHSFFSPQNALNKFTVPITTVIISNILLIFKKNVTLELFLLVTMFVSEVPKLILMFCLYPKYLLHVK